jgi:hypothetical protein
MLSADATEVSVSLLKLGPATAKAVRFLLGGVQRRRRLIEDVRDAKQALGLVDPAGEAYRSDAVHPLYTPGELHPDNKAALTAAGAEVLALDPTPSDRLHVQATDNSLLLFGSPTSEGLSRLVFGYSPADGVEGLVRSEVPIDLPYAWELDPSELGSGRVGRFVAGKGLVERPPWWIRDLRKRSGKSRDDLTPVADSEDLITTDFLLITRVPNFLSLDAQRRGRFLVSIGGAHGTGTRAVQLLLKDKRKMQKTIELLKEKHRLATGRVGGVPSAYQLLFRVHPIVHRNGQSIPTGLELVDAVVLSGKASEWDSARSLITPRLGPEGGSADHERGS